MQIGTILILTTALCKWATKIICKKCFVATNQLDIQFFQQPVEFHVSNAELSWKLVHSLLFG